MKNKLLSFFLIVCLILPLSSCGSDTESVNPVKNEGTTEAVSEKLETETLSIEHETKFGGIYLHMTADEMLAFGFEYGDSVSVRISSGFTAEDIPFYNGFYTNTGDTLLCAYPEYPYVRLCIDNGDDLYISENLDESCTAVITLNQKGKYLPVQKMMSMVCSDERESYSSDEQFANFRVMSCGNITDGMFYRSASPCDDQHNRASYSDILCEEVGIGYIIDLADSEEELRGYYSDDSLKSPYWRSLYENGKVLAVDMASNYRSEVFAEKTASAMRAVLSEKGPFLIHCTEGKDRTGFVCLIIEALSGAGMDELRADYMKTYENYYGITEQSYPDGYLAVVHLRFDDMVAYFCGVDDVSGITEKDLVSGIEKYLEFGGMSDDEIGLLERALTDVQD